ncbi:MAG: ATP-binding protein [candidate division Zixibacteria bacterium]|nr:ATP-binding protein [candidate division Zixibacteria bacterium]
MIKKEFVYKSISESENKMLDDVEMFLDENKISGELKNRFMLCVSEAFTNALVHGNKLDPNKEIKIKYMLSNTTLNADVIDEGHGGVEKVNKRKRPELLAESGRGVGLIKHYSSSFVISENEEGGLQLKIVFEINKERVNCT